MEDEFDDSDDDDSDCNDEDGREDYEEGLEIRRALVEYLSILWCVEKSKPAFLLFFFFASLFRYCDPRQLSISGWGCGGSKERGGDGKTDE